jgi:hypothetical protein
MNGKTQIVLGLMLLGAAGCGSSGAGADGGGHAGSGPGGSSGGGSGGKGGAGGSVCQPFVAGDGTMTWDDNGNAECGTITEATRMINATQDFIEIVGATTTGYGVAITVVSYSEGPLGGSYHCKNDAGISALYVDFVYHGTVQDCTITIDNPGGPGGAHATGSFSATAIGSDGGSIEVTNGVFDTPITLSGG